MTMKYDIKYLNEPALCRIHDIICKHLGIAAVELHREQWKAGPYYT